MLAISIRVRQLLWTKTDPFQLKLRSSVLSVAVSVVLAVLAALIVLIVSVAQIVFVALIVFVAVVAAAVVSKLNISRFLTKTVIAKVPAVVAGNLSIRLNI